MFLLLLAANRYSATEVCMKEHRFFESEQLVSQVQSNISGEQFVIIPVNKLSHEKNTHFSFEIQSMQILFA